jgi:hypothetical protein
MQNEGDRSYDYFIWVDEEAMLPMSQFNVQIANQKKGFEIELAKLTLYIDAKKCKTNSMGKILRMSLATYLILVFVLLSCFVSDREKHHCTVSMTMLP